MLKEKKFKVAHKFFKNYTGRLQFCGLWHCAVWYEGTSTSEEFAACLSKKGGLCGKMGIVEGKSRIGDCSVCSNRNADILQCSEWNWNPWNHFLHHWDRYV